MDPLYFLITEFLGMWSATFKKPLSSAHETSNDRSNSFTTTLINISQHNYFIMQGYTFGPFKRSSSVLLTDAVYMFGSQYIFIDKIHKIRQVSYLGRSVIIDKIHKIRQVSYLSRSDICTHISSTKYIKSGRSVT